MRRNHLERTTGCRIEDGWTYKGLRTLVLQNEKLKLSLLLDKGTDIFELIYKPFDLDLMFRTPRGVQNPKDVFRGPVNSETSFFDSYAGGWQEILPSGSGGSNYRGALFGLHGEVAQLPWDYSILVDTPEQITVRLTVRTVRSPYFLVKDITVKQGQAIVYFEETVTNEGETELDLMWGHHPAFGHPFIGPKTRLDLPDCEIHTLPDPYSDRSCFAPGQVFTWPLAKNISSKNVDLHQLPGLKLGSSDMLYATKLQDGWAAITNLELGIGVGYIWDLQTFKYLWIWNEAKGTTSYPWYGRARAFAIEPFTSLPETGENGLLQAIENGTSVRVLPNQSIHTRFSVVIYETHSPVKRIAANGVVTYE